VIAQEVEKVFPEAVSTAPDGYKAVGYSTLVAPLIQAIKEFYHKVMDREITAFKTYLCTKDSAALFCK
jgi:trimeric autotransporter adhesin